MCCKRNATVCRGWTKCIQRLKQSLMKDGQKEPFKTIVMTGILSVAFAMLLIGLLLSYRIQNI